MRYKTISDIKPKGKRILLRVDLNSEIIKGKIIISDRLIAHAKTIKELLRKKAKVVVIAHQSRPGKKDFISLKQHAKLLNKYVKISFVNDILGNKAINKIKKLKQGEALLLENIRFLKEEFKPSTSNKIVKTLAPLFDYYINDAFSIAHRRHTSIVSFPKKLPSCIGRVMENEVKNLRKIKNMKNCLFILGGAKPEDSILLLKNKKVLTCGLFGHLCLIAKGHNLGAQNKFLKKELRFIPRIKRHVKNVETPIDLAIKINNKRKEVVIKEFPSKYEIFDIGPETTKGYVEYIKKAKTIFLKGTAGDCEDKKFCKGTKAILKAIEKSRAFSIVAGGHTNTALKRLKINRNKIGYVSLSGGALVAHLSGKKLPGLEVLKKCLT